MTDDAHEAGSGGQGHERRAAATRRSFLQTTGAVATVGSIGAGVSGTATAAEGELNAVAFDFSKLPDLGDGAVYEGWAIYDGGAEKVSTGRFSTGEEYVFEVDRDLSMAEKLVVTIEPTEDDDPAPSGVVVLAGPVEGEQVDLSFPVHFDSATGSYILATPTNGGNSNETSGIWFLDPSGGGPSASLDLPELPGGWTYEGWVVHEGTPLSTGRFDDPAAADGSAPYSAMGHEAPPFPGEDFLRNAPEGLSFPTDLTDGSSKAVISVEPDIDGMDPTGEAPFQPKPLVGEIPADASDHTSYDLQRNPGTLPSGDVHVEEGVGGSVGGPTTNGLVLDVETLPDLSEGKYQVWLVDEDPPQDADPKFAVGTFASGGVFQFETNYGPDDFDRVVVTIEPGDDVGFEASGTVVLAGALSDGADLSFPVSFDSASGSYILATPTNGSGSDETSGIWFLDPSGDGPSASLDLPDLPDGWTYEGWVVHEGTPLSTGRFDDPAAADGSAPYSAMGHEAPPFPGEDFLRNAPDGLSFPTDLTDGSSKAVISVEPDVDGTDPTGEAPFQVKPLVGEIPEDGTDHASYDLGRNEGTLPDGSATLHEDAAAARGEGDPLQAVSFDFSKLPDLGDGAVYEGWAIYDGGAEKVSTGRFSTGEEYVFEVDRDLSAAEKIVVTIEPAEGDDPAPSGVVVLAGPVDGDSAALSFPVSFDGVSGSYILATPTNGGDSNETSGIWFLDPSGGGPSASLDLPELPGGWTYEGWVVHEGTPLSTGRFDDPAAADGSAPYSGEMDGPPFPGEDFLRNAPEGLSFPTDLADGDSRAVITVEPDLDGTDPTGAAPFQIKPLAGDVPADASDHTSYDLTAPGPAVPSGTATLHESAPSSLPIVGDGAAAPTDPDGDGLYEDVNGNGEQEMADVVTLFQQRESDAVQDNVDAYDFSGNEKIDLGDVVQLLEENTS